MFKKYDELDGERFKLFLMILALLFFIGLLFSPISRPTKDQKIQKCLNDFDEQIKINNSLESLLKVCERVSK